MNLKHTLKKVVFPEDGESTYLRNVREFFVYLFYILLFIFTLIRSRDSVDSIATGCGMNDRGVGVRVPVR
jgi:hypothetical protein